MRRTARRAPSSRCSPGKELATIPVGTAQDAKDAIARARVAQKEWAKRPVTERAAIFHRYRDLVLENLDSLMDMAQAETGKSRAAAQEEILDIAMTARHYARVAPKLLRPRRVTRACCPASPRPSCATSRRASSASSRRGTTR